MPSTPSSILVICAHADDAELNAGGTLTKCVAAGGQVHIVMVTDNCSGCLIGPEGESAPLLRLGPAETSAVRNAEQQTAADLIGVKMHWLDFAQRHYWDATAECEVEVAYAQPGEVDAAEAGRPMVLLACHERPHVDALAELILEIAPDVVLSHGPLDIDPEHHAVASLAWRAMRQVRETLPHCPLRTWTPGGSCPGGMLAPAYDIIEDISETFPTKVKLCEVHASQMTAARRKRLAEEAKHFGRQINATYGEPFATARFCE